MNEKPLISIFNLKNGVGCSAIAWNIAHTLELNIYQHEKGMHHIFIDQRNQSVGNNDLYENSITAEFINKRVFKSGIYDLGSDINYPYVRQILNKSDVIVIPCELGYEIMLKTIVSIKYAKQQNDDCKIYVVFNKLDKSDPVRERNYTVAAEKLIKEIIGKKNMKNIKFLYIRYSFAIFRKLASGFYFLDHYIHQQKSFPEISSFQLLRNLRWYTLNKQAYDSKRSDKGESEIEKSIFYAKHENFYKNYTATITIKDIYDLGFNDNNRKIVKDMLILTTKIKEEYTRTWDYDNA